MIVFLTERRILCNLWVSQYLSHFSIYNIYPTSQLNVLTETLLELDTSRENILHFVIHSWSDKVYQYNVS